MENILENKAKFFAQYYAQRVLCVKGGNPNFMPVSHWNTIQTYDHFKDSWLELKHLSSITDEDAIEVCEMSYRDLSQQDKSERLEIGKRIVKGCISDDPSYFSALLFITVYQYLQSKGYALPYMGLSVEKQVEYGWVKLKGE